MAARRSPRLAGSAAAAPSAAPRRAAPAPDPPAPDPPAPDPPAPEATSAPEPEAAPASSAPEPEPAAEPAEVAEALDSSAAALQLLAQQQADYRRRLVLLQHQQELWQRLQQQQQQQGGAALAVATAEERMQHVHQRLQERVLASGQQSGQMSPQEIEKARLEQLQRIQQFQMRAQQQYQQSLAAASAEAQRRGSEEIIRTQLLMEQERLRLMRLREQGQASEAAAQQQVMQQQQLLQQLLQKQQHERLVLQQQQQQQALNAVFSAAQAKTAANGGAAAHNAKPATTTVQSDPQMEALVRTLAQVNSASTTTETAAAVEKMSEWVHQCADLILLRFASRDFPLVEASQRMKLAIADTWTAELQTKCASIAAKILQTVASLEAQQSSSNTVRGVPPEAREQAYSALKAQLLYKQNALNAQKKTPASTTESAQKRALQVDTSAASPGAVKKPRTLPSPVIPGTYGVTIATGLTPSALVARARPGPMSPREAQRLYELNLSMRTTGAADDADDKLYFPTKVISKIMRRVLPGGDSSVADAHKNSNTTENAQLVKKEVLEESVSSEDEKLKQTPETQEGDSESAKEQKDAATAKATPSTSTPSLQRFASDTLDIKISDDAVTLMQECATEFLLFLTSEARDHAALKNPTRKKKAPGLVISGSSVIDSLHNLGFTPYATILDKLNVKAKAMIDMATLKKMERKQAKQAAAAAEKKALAMAAAAASPAGGLVPTTVVSTAATTPAAISTAQSGTVAAPVNKQ